MGMRFHHRVLKSATILISVSLYAWSLWEPALLFKDHAPLTGATVLALGWFGVLSLDFAWYANPAWLMAAVFLIVGKVRLARISSGVSVLLALLSFTTKQWWFNEARPTAISGLGPACYIWMSSLAVLSLGCILNRQPNQSPLSTPSL